MKLAPHHRIAPFRYDSRQPILRVELAIDRRDVIVGGHDPERLGGPDPVLAVHVAPPEHRLYAAQQTHPAVLAEHLAQGRVYAALDAVVGGGHGAIEGQPLVQVREQSVGAHEPVQARPRLHQALVGQGLPAVPRRRLGQEPVPPLAPSQVLRQPRGGRLGVADLEQPLGYGVELRARGEVRPGGRVALDLAERIVFDRVFFCEITE